MVITSALLAVITGFILWLLQPQQSFGWVESSHLDYIVGANPMAAQPPGYPDDTISFADYPEVLAHLEEQLEGDYAAYVSTTRTGRRIILATGESFPLFQEFYVGGRYFSARQVDASYGELIDDGAEDAVVVGYALARRLFGDPAEAVGQGVYLSTLGAEIAPEVRTIVGVLSPSPNQDPELDPDWALIGPLGPRLEEDGPYPLHVFLRFFSVPEAIRLTPELRRWTRQVFGPAGVAQPIDSLLTDRSEYVEGMLPRLAARRATLSTFGFMLVVSAVLALYTQSYHSLLRHRQRLGVERALGARRSRLALRMVLAQVCLGAAGGLVGVLSLGVLSSLLPHLFPSPPAAAVFGLAFLVPVVVLLVLSTGLVFRSLTQSSMTLMRGRASSLHMVLLLFLVYLGLSLAAAAGLAAAQVSLQGRAEAGALQNQFGLIYALQTRDRMVDLRLERAFESPFDDSAPFTAQDTHALKALDGIEDAVLAHPIPSLEVSYASGNTRLTAVVADDAYLDFMGMSLTGSADDCILSLTKARELGIGLSQTVRLQGQENSVPCRVGGFFEAPSKLWSWLVADLPDLLVPPLSGLNPSGDGAPSFGSTRMLLELATPTSEQAVRLWLAEEYPDIQAEVIPYTPDVQTLLASLRVQAQIFLLVAVLAAVLSVWGIVGGFLALLDAERFRLAIDRALGLSLARLTRAWWWRTLGLSALSAALGLLVGALLNARLYNALALDIPNLPARASLALGPLPLLALALALLALSGGLTWLAYRRLGRQSALTLLKEGTA